MALVPTVSNTQVRNREMNGNGLTSSYFNIPLNGDDCLAKYKNGPVDNSIRSNNRRETLGKVKPFE